MLFNFLRKCIKLGSPEEFTKSNFQTVTQLLIGMTSGNGGSGGIQPSAEQHFLTGSVGRIAAKKRREKGDGLLLFGSLCVIVR